MKNFVKDMKKQSKTEIFNMIKTYFYEVPRARKAVLKNFIMYLSKFNSKVKIFGRIFQTNFSEKILL